MALRTLTHRISKEWIHIDQAIKKDIKQYIISLINQTILL